MKVQSIVGYRSNSRDKDCSPFFGYTRTKLGKEIDVFIGLKDPSHEQKSELFCKLTKFAKQLQESIKEPIGEGFKGVVYKVDDKYVLKTGKRGASFNGGSISIEKIPYDELKTYYGRPLLKFSNELQVLRNVSSAGGHFPVGVPYKMPFDSSMQMKLYWNKQCLPRYAALPQKSFDALARDFAVLNNYGGECNNYIFDVTNPNNFVIAGKSTLRIVDEIDIVRAPRKNTVAALISPFLESMSLAVIVPNSAENSELRKQLLKKIILAGEKYDLPYTSSELTNASLTSIYEKGAWLHACRDFCKYQDLIKELLKLRIDYPDKKERLNRVQLLLDEKLQYRAGGYI